MVSILLSIPGSNAVSKYIIFTEDQQLMKTLNDVFTGKQIVFRRIDEFPSCAGSECNVAILDGDALPVSQTARKLPLFKRKKIPVVYIFSSLGGREVMELINLGVVSVLFKDYPGERIKKELAQILYNHNYLERVKEIAENDNRTKKFLKVVNSLTSDNDINKIMHDILAAMIDVFKLESTVFFIVKNNRLERKIVLGTVKRDYPAPGWEMEEYRAPWLKRIREKREPFYINAKSNKECLEDFPGNTLLLPLVIKERFFGMIAAVFKSGAKKVDKGEITLLKAFAEQTAVALENAKLYWDVIKAQEKLVEQEKKNLLNQTIISLNHEINNPLSIISMEAQLLQSRMDKTVKTGNKIEERLEKIEINIDRIKSILDKISSLSVGGDLINPTEYADGKMMLNLYET